MYLSVDSPNFDPHYIIINNKTKNNIMNNSDFLRIYYSDEYMTTNGLFISFKLKNIIIDKYFNKIKCHIDKSDFNKNVINQLLRIEKNILNKMTEQYSEPVYRIEEQLKQNYIKIFPSETMELRKYNNLNFLLKISGIWSTDIHKKYGLTFRFFIVEDN